MSNTKTVAKDAIGATVSRDERLKLFRELPLIQRTPEQEYKLTEARQVFKNVSPQVLMDFYCSMKFPLMFPPGFISHKEPLDPNKPQYGHVGDRWFVEWDNGHWGVEEICEFDKENHRHSYVFGRDSNPNHSVIKYLFEEFEYHAQGNDTLVVWKMSWVPTVGSIIRVFAQPFVSMQIHGLISKALAHRAEKIQEYLNDKNG
jgi:hypothetical protein